MSKHFYGMYIVYGYDWMYRPVTMYFDSFVAAVRAYREAYKEGPAFLTRSSDKAKSCLFVK